MTKEYQMVMIVKSERRYDNAHLTKPSTHVDCLGIITIKPHRVGDRQRDCIDIIIMAVLDRNNGMI